MSLPSVLYRMIRKRTQILEVQQLILPVLLNISLTLAGWYFVYDMKVDEELAHVFYLSNASNYSTGYQITDAMVNALGSVVVIGIVAFLMLTLALLNCRRMVKCWLYASCFMMLFVISYGFYYDLTALFTEDDRTRSIAAAIPTVIYGTIGLLVFFTDNLSPRFHQLYVICNCALVSIYYLRAFPGYTSWCVLLAVAGWDMFAVLSPFGPLRWVQEKAGDYNAHILRFLMFTANRSDRFMKSNAEEEESDESDESSDEATEEVAHSLTPAEGLVHRRPGRLSAGADPTPEAEENVLSPNVQPENSILGNERSVEDALNDDNYKLGMGDFVFYSVLVGSAAVSRSIFATLAAVVGVLIGLCVTLVGIEVDGTTPALPVSIIMGMLLHFGALQIEKVAFYLFQLISNFFA